MSSTKENKTFSIKLIDLDNDNTHAFSPGDKILGKFHINMKNLTAYNTASIELTLLGLAYVKWDMLGLSETEDEFLRLRKNWLGRLPASSFEILFNFELPKNILPSVELRYGFVSYSLQASFTAYSQNPHIASLQINDVLGFTVKSPIDLSRSPALRARGEASDERTFCCGPCVSSPLKIDFTIEKKGYLPGEIIRCETVVKNFTTRDVNAMCVNLVFSSEFKMRRYGVTLLKMSHVEIKDTYSFKDTIRSLSNAKWSNISLKIPQTLVSPGAFSSKLIKTRYYVELTVYIDRARRPTRVKIPIIIGTMPLSPEKALRNESLGPSAQQRHAEHQNHEVKSPSKIEHAAVKVENADVKACSSKAHNSDQFYDSSEEFEIVPECIHRDTKQ